MPRITASAPLLLVRDVVAAANHYRDCLGFHYEHFFGDPPGFCILHRDDHYLMLAQAEDPATVIPLWKVREKTPGAYFWIDDADGLCAEFRAHGATIDYGPCTQPYQVREFGIQDIDGHDIAFGQVLKQQ